MTRKRRNIGKTEGTENTSIVIITTNMTAAMMKVTEEKEVEAGVHLINDPMADLGGLDLQQMNQDIAHPHIGLDTGRLNPNRGPDPQLLDIHATLLPIDRAIVHLR